MTVGTGLFLTHNTPATDTELERIELELINYWLGQPHLMELVATAESEGVLQDPLLVHRNQQLVTAN